MLKVLYLAHDLADPAVRRRVLMLTEGGASVTLSGFRRGENALAAVNGLTPIELGRTVDAKFGQRMGAVAKAVVGLRGLLNGVERPDVIIGRNLEALAVAERASHLFGGVPIVYECLDIHRLLVNDGITGRAVRRAEAYFGRDAKLILTSSPAFIANYFVPRSALKAPIMLVENKVLALNGMPEATPLRLPPNEGEPWKIGWFGALRCRKSLQLLADFSRRMNGRVRIVLRGRPAYSEFEDFDAFVANEPYLSFEGPYKNPEDLPTIYSDVHFSWAIDFFEEGLNSSWLLPNRIYEGCLHGSVPIALAGTETARFLSRKDIGLTLHDASVESLEALFEGLAGERYATLAAAVAAEDRKSWLADRSDCRALVDNLSRLVPSDAEAHAAAASNPATAVPEGSTAMKPDACSSVASLIIIPCLNEARHIKPLIEKLGPALDQLNARIVVADGGSTDGTREIVGRISETDPRVILLDNPRRIQSAAINLAVKTFGRDYEYLIRIDAHGDYPADYCQRLVEEAELTQADSVVVAMETIGFGIFQKATAFAQNSKLGNGGSKHREGAKGHWTDHGHHALMRIAAFDTVGGYDETFSHNEDAELDYRLKKAGFGIWMTDKTRMIYYPRSTVGTLFRQYLGYGRGRAKNILKHGSMPNLRQMLPLAVVPVFIGAFLAVLSWIAVIPFSLWAVACVGYGFWMAVGQRNPYGPLAAISAMVMHFAWSAGFWMELLSFRNRKAS
ncbi:succinoglycan biosynthesis protein ExoA [Rhizobium mongolense]|uniref:Succinoglycan biosynthesis protein ExoA n=3 Tax=Rhizobium mongolense TaxID=57676 RepID=A0ABR6IVB3_9HYPH|nr:succinoglycan biosynthesis protein ExoA [Rhizobium mongolense]TVZ66802.1 succinoglycan biosynthesis protein ExoA [Rhizobium mongolense USDA 1844]